MAKTAPRQALLSSNRTLFWRVFLPVFGTVFFTGMLLALWLIDESELPSSYPIWWLRATILVIWLLWLYFVKTRLWPLKRIDSDAEHLYVTNYWTTVRYPWSDVESVTEVKKWRYRLMQLKLRASGRFGQFIYFLPVSNFQIWMDENGKSDLIVQDANS